MWCLECECPAPIGVGLWILVPGDGGVWRCLGGVARSTSLEVGFESEMLLPIRNKLFCP